MSSLEKGSVSTEDGATRSNTRLSNESEIRTEDKSKDSRCEVENEELWSTHHPLDLDRRFHRGSVAIRRLVEEKLETLPERLIRNIAPPC